MKNIKDKLSDVFPGDVYKGIVKITRKVKPGPTILVVTDVTKSIDAVTKDTQFDVGDVVQLEGSVSERAGKLQIEIQTIRKSEKNFDEVIDEQSKPFDKPLSITSDRMSQLRSQFIEVAHIIRKAILNNQPILIRHHADADGIMSGMAIEKACRLYMEQIGLEPHYHLFRSPSRAPFYEVSDMFKDIGFTKKVLESHDQQKPLILVVDNGSTPEDVFAMKSLKSMGFDIVVIDHHNPVVLENGVTAVCPYLKYHINPYRNGLDSKTSAGMLCYEVARLIHNSFDAPLMPAIAAIGDRCDIPETDEYLAVAGKSREEIQKMVVAIDFIAYNLKFDSGAGVYDEVFANNGFVDMINEKVREGVDTQLQSTLPYLRTQELHGIIFSFIDLEKYTLRFTYPTPGKVIGMIHDKVALGKEQSPVLSLGFLSDMVIIRATQPVLPVATIIKNLQKDLPEANVDGGGHECAGTIKFVSAHQSAILQHIKQQIRSLKRGEDDETYSEAN
ncbi:MAG: DHH family phosphoesterase [Candidatus Woesearchaeota archaeon]